MSFLSIDPDGNVLDPSGKVIGGPGFLNKADDDPKFRQGITIGVDRGPLAHLGARLSDVGDQVQRWVEDQWEEDNDGNS